MKKALKKICSWILMFCISLFFGCTNVGSIPNGKYILPIGVNYYEYSPNSDSDNYIEIKGRTLRWILLGVEDYRAEIVKRDGEIYCEGYVWVDDAGEECGNYDIYRVEYDADKKIIHLYFVTPNPDEDTHQFLELKTAYERGHITKNDICAIAEKHNNGMCDELSDGVAQQLKTCYVKANPRENWSFNDVEIKEYLGSFSHCFAVIIAYKDEITTGAWSETIDDIEIFYNNGFRVLIFIKY